MSTILSFRHLPAACFAFAVLFHPAMADAGPAPAQRVDYKIGFLGAPSFPKVEWNDGNLQRMKDLGFNVMQLNIAWGSRPNDEPLNLEDLVALPQPFTATPGDIDRQALRTPAKLAERTAKVQQRIEISRKFGFRTMFHFGAPNILYPPLEPEVRLDQCLSDEATTARYVALIKAFQAKFPGVDDLLCYTYDQHAWLCSEAGSCPRCHGVPLHDRVTKFLNAMARTWRELNPKGVLYWEPWELSAGETYQCIDLLDASCVGLSLHSSIAEVQIAFPADRWFKNVLIKALDRNLPVIGELWTGSLTEEMEPFIHIATPLATLKALRAVNTAGKLKGIKEYYGNVPDKEDPNLRMSGLFFQNPDLTDDDALTELAKPYGEASPGVAAYWRLASEAVELYPWEVSWLARTIGKVDPVHLLTAATIKGASWQTPAWQSSRRTAYLRTDQTEPPNFWTRENTHLCLEQAAMKMDEAIKAAQSVTGKVPATYEDTFAKSVQELGAFRRTALSFAYHLRETNLADLIRGSIKQGLPVNAQNVAELRALLVMDQQNMEVSEPILTALAMFDADFTKFLATYFLPTPPTGTKIGAAITSQ